MDELFSAALSALSVHCGQEEYAKLRATADAVDTLDARVLAELAARYDARIGDLVPRQRAELRAVSALFVMGHEGSAREMARVAFRRLVRTVDDLPAE